MAWISMQCTICDSFGIWTQTCMLSRLVPETRSVEMQDSPYLHRPQNISRHCSCIHVSAQICQFINNHGKASNHIVASYPWCHWIGPEPGNLRIQPHAPLLLVCACAGVHMWVRMIAQSHCLWAYLQLSGFWSYRSIRFPLYIHVSCISSCFMGTEYYFLVTESVQTIGVTVCWGLSELSSRVLDSAFSIPLSRLSLEELWQMTTEF